MFWRKLKKADSKKLLIVCRTLPPMIVGSSIIMSNLVNNYKGEISAIGGWQYEAKVDSGFKLNCETTYVKFNLKIFQRIFEKYSYKFIDYIKNKITQKAKEKKADFIMGVYPNSVFFVAAYLAAKEEKIPFIAYMHDLWQENYKADSANGKLAVKYEREILTNSYKVFCMTGIQKNFYDEKYNGSLKTDLLPHSIPDEKLDEFKPKDDYAASAPAKILYTGNISHGMNIDAIKELIKSLDYLDKNISVTILSSFDKEALKRYGIFDERISYNWVDMKVAFEMQKKSDILFLPLSFKNCSPLEVKTVYATKTLDYLVSGTPILVFSPPESFHSVSARQSGWGYVVEKDDSKFLAEGINKLLNDTELRKNLVLNSFKEAKRRKSSLIAEKLYNTINN
jgi:glycosyltransferase involved in cell wall biosynthesis